MPYPDQWLVPVVPQSRSSWILQGDDKTLNFVIGDISLYLFAFTVHSWVLHFWRKEWEVANHFSPTSSLRHFSIYIRRAILSCDEGVYEQLYFLAFASHDRKLLFCSISPNFYTCFDDNSPFPAKLWLFLFCKYASQRQGKCVCFLGDLPRYGIGNYS